MKIIAFYLPQFHNIPENDEWWGDGFTEWVNVKKSQPLYEGHYQPRVPLGNNYYNLLDDNVKKWQVNLAKKYGIYGFCYYHYWFSGHMLLEKPMVQMLENKEIDLPFCVCWANEPWTKAWVGDAKKVLIPQNYGREKEWKEHFDYLLPFFKDERYIMVDGRPLFVLYRPEIVGCLNEMLDYWNKLAKEEGFKKGFCFAYQNIDFDLQKDKDDSRFDMNIEFEPLYAYRDMYANQHKYLKAIRRNISNWVGKHFGIDLLHYGENFFNKNKPLSYDKAWEAILKRKPESKKNVPGAFVGFDNSPRRGSQAKIYDGATPEKFEKYMIQQVKRARNIYNSDFLFVTAWNEWAECGYLEPDEKYQYGYLEAIKNALLANGELEK